MSTWRQKNREKKTRALRTAKDMHREENMWDWKYAMTGKRSERSKRTWDKIRKVMIEVLQESMAQSMGVSVLEVQNLYK